MADDNLNDIALVVMYIGLAWWLGSTVLFIARGFTRHGHARFRKALFWFASIFAGLAVWIAGMLFLGYKT
ncbi:MAG: hypothetical protein AB1742_12180 [bacterium]